MTLLDLACAVAAVLTACNAAVVLTILLGDAWLA